MSRNFEIYAEKFFKFARKNNIDFEKILKDKIENLIEIFQKKNQKDDLISKFLKSSSVKFSKKIDLIKEICSEEYFLNFLSVINKCGDFEKLEKILEAIMKNHNFSKNLINAEVYSVVQIDEKQTEEIKKIIFKETGCSAFIKNKIKKDIIGGFVVKLDSMILDMSLKKLLQQIKFRLFQERV